MVVLGALATLLLMPIVTTMIWEIFIRDRALESSRRVRYRLGRRFGKEPPTGQLLTRLTHLCICDQSTSLVMGQEQISRLALDACFEILHSHRYAGWRPHEIEYMSLAKAPPLTGELAGVVSRYPADPPNNGKYRLSSYSPDSSERPTLLIQLAPTDYFSTYPIQRRLFEDVLRDVNGQPTSPFVKYGAGLTEFGDHPLPNIVCLHALVVLPNGNLLLTQRLRSTDRLDWHAGKWSCSFEEQMTIKVPDPRNDKTFLDTAYAGCEEELGVLPDRVRDVRILSLVLEAAWNVVAPIAIVEVDTPFEEIHALWQLKARDGVSRELRNLAEISWSPDAVLPILRREDTQIGKFVIGPDEWHGTARMRLLQGLFHKDGIDSTLKALARQ